MNPRLAIILLVVLVILFVIGVAAGPLAGDVDLSAASLEDGGAAIEDGVLGFLAGPPIDLAELRATSANPDCFDTASGRVTLAVGATCNLLIDDSRSDIEQRIVTVRSLRLEVIEGDCVRADLRGAPRGNALSVNATVIRPGAVTPCDDDEPLFKIFSDHFRVDLTCQQADTRCIIALNP